MEGRFCRLEPLDPAKHARELFEANQPRQGRAQLDVSVRRGRSRDFGSYRAWLEQVAKGDDPLFHTIIDRETGKAVGVATFMRIDRRNGVIEVGNINYSPLLQRTPAATEAMFLMMRRVFDELGYRRYEWKCDCLNAPSRAAALRLGFQYEGLFRQAVVYKGRNRDTAWFSIIDSEWPALKRAYEPGSRRRTSMRRPPAAQALQDLRRGGLVCARDHPRSRAVESGIRFRDGP